MAKKKPKKTAKDKKAAENTALLKKLSQDPNIAPLLPGIKGIAGGDSAILGGLLGGGQLGGQLFGPGSLGRLDEDILNDPDVRALLDRTRSDTLTDPREQADAVAVAKNAVANSDINSGINQDVIQRLKDAGEITPAQAEALGLAGERARTAGNLSSLENEILNLRRSSLGGMGAKELTALKEGGGYDAQGNFIPGERAISSAARTALSSMQANNRISGGPRGRASLIQARPILQQTANATADLQRKLILDEYQSKIQAEDSFVRTAGDINSGVQQRTDTAIGQYGQIANQQGQQKAQAGIALGEFVRGTNQNYVGASSNLTTAAGNLESTRANRLQRFLDTVGNVRNESLFRQTYNMDQLSKERAGMSSSIFGGGAFAAEQAGRKESADIANKQIEAAKSFNTGGGSRGGSSNTWGGSGSSSSTGSGAADSFDTA